MLKEASGARFSHLPCKGVGPYADLLAGRLQRILTNLAGFKAFAAFSVMLPAKVPPALVKRLAAEISKAMKNPATAARLEQQALLPVSDTPQQFAASLKDEQQMWVGFIKQHHIVPDRKAQRLWSRR